jgi:hypothetical protein
VKDREKLYWRNKEEIGGKIREIACPIGSMRRVHDQLKHLLNRIEQPDYLYSPRRGRSAWQNAAAHLSSKVVVTLDIQQFYPSTSEEHVFEFFYHIMGMTEDVAGLITKLTTIDGHLPFGSPLSPV